MHSCMRSSSIPRTKKLDVYYSTERARIKTSLNKLKFQELVWDLVKNRYTKTYMAALRSMTPVFKNPSLGQN